ncbi:MAG: cyclase family protein [Actinobacteria bacterium]|jgi:arylformamidase|nr:MAG: cyclase family protein [Actinomycetota bacterium]
MGWIDISVTVRSGMAHWPTDEAVGIERICDLDRGDPYNLSRILMSLHTGTHMDAPIHFIRDGAGIDEMPLEAAIGRARVIEIRDRELIRPAELQEHGIERGERILFKTANSGSLWDSDAFSREFVSVSEAAASFLAAAGITLVGVDYLSVGGFNTDIAKVHLALLEAGVWIIEGLNLAGVEPGDYELVCLPLKVARGDGAPARAILRPLR